MKNTLDNAPDTAEPEQPETPPNNVADQGGKATGKPREIGGPSGPEPTRYGDWERNGRCSDF